MLGDAAGYRGLRLNRHGGQIGSRFEETRKPITVFYLGDQDPSGHDIPRDIYARAQMASGKTFRMFRVAIHPSDIEAFHLRPQRIKATDSRAAGFVKRFGATAPTVELDALPVDELRRRVRAAIEGLIDFALWDRPVAVHEVELRCIADFADKVKNLPQLAKS